MKLRILKRLFPVVLLAVLAAVPVFAKDHANITLGHSASINGTALPQGNYKVSWVSHSPQATVTFIQGGKTLATAEGKWVDRNTKFDSDQVLYSSDGDGAKKVVEIRFAGMSQALVFGDADSAS